jgi:hypothetical protein
MRYLIALLLLTGVATADVVTSLVDSRKAELQAAIVRYDQDIAVYQGEIVGRQALKAQALTELDEYDKVDVTVKPKPVVIDEGIYK